MTGLPHTAQHRPTVPQQALEALLPPGPRGSGVPFDWLRPQLGEQLTVHTMQCGLCGPSPPAVSGQSPGPQKLGLRQEGGRPGAFHLQQGVRPNPTPAAQQQTSPLEDPLNWGLAGLGLQTVPILS